MSVDNTTPVNFYNTNGITTNFPFDFKILEEADLSIMFDQGDLPAHVITGVGDDDGGNVAFVTPPAAGRLALVRSISLSRSTDYQYQGPLPSKVVNDDFDRIWMALQDNGYFFGSGDLTKSRALILGATDINGSGSYRAMQNRIQDLADPIGLQDGVNLRSLQLAIANAVISGGGGETLLGLLGNTTDTTLGVSLIGGAIRTVGSIAALRNVVSAKNPAVYVGSYYGNGMGGGGFFDLDVNDTTSSDDGGDVIVTTDGGRMRRRMSDGVIRVKDYGARGTDAGDDLPAIIKARDKAVAVGARLVFPGGANSVYRTSTKLELAYKGLWVSFEGGAMIHCVGSGPILSLDAGVAGPTRFDIRIDHPRLRGNAASTHAMYIRYVSHYVVEGLRAYDFTGSLVYATGSIIGTFYDPVVSANEQAFTVQPANGFFIDQPSAGNYSVGIRAFNPTIEGVSGAGIYLANASNCEFLGGTSEGNGQGIFIAGSTTNNNNNRFVGMWFEANGAGGDADINGRGNSFSNCYFGSVARTNNIEMITADSTSFHNCYIRCINRQSSSTNTNIYSGSVSDDPSLGVKGLGTGRNIGVVKTNTSGVVTGMVPEFDDGTFLPFLAGGTTPGSNTYTTRSGSYSKISPTTVAFQIYVVMSAKSGMTGAVRIGGLPFNAKSYTAVSIAEVDRVTTVSTNTQIGGYIPPGSNAITLTQFGGQNGGTGVIDASNVGDTAGFIVSGTYMI